MQTLNGEDRAVEACIGWLQGPLFQAAKVCGARVLLRSIAVIVAASIRAMISRRLMSLIEARALLDEIERIALSTEPPPDGAEIPFEHAA